MKKRNHILLLALIVAVLGGLAWVVLRELPEPVYQGKTLTAWLEQDSWPVIYQHPPPGYEAAEAKRAVARAEAEVAIKHIGTNALPYLIKMAAEKDSTLKEKLIALLGRQSLVSIHFRQAADYHCMALHGFALLGSQAAPAVPSLIRLLKSHPTISEADFPDAGLYLVIIGKAAVPDLLQCLNDKDEHIRLAATYALIRIDPEAASKAGVK